MKASTTAGPAPLPGKVARLLRESKWFALIALAVFLSLILITHRLSDPGWSNSLRADQIHNAGGVVGAWFADLLLSLFGISAWWWVVLCVYAVIWGYRRLDGSAISDRRPFIIAVTGFMLTLLGSAGLEALRFYSAEVALPMGHGGMLGSILSKGLYAAMGFTGATLLLMAMFAIGLSLFTGISWLTAIESLGAAVEWIWSSAVTAWHRRQDEKAGAIATVQREAMVDADKRRFEDHQPIRIEAPVMDIPKSERVIKERQAPLFQDLPDTPLPPLALLDEASEDVEVVSAEMLEFTSRLIEKKLSDFGVEVKVLAAYPGPVITRYEIEPAVGVKGSQIVNLVKDLARALSVVSIRVVETIPGKTCMGLEIPNAKRQTVRLSEILGSQVYADMASPITLALGKDIGGHPIVADLAKMPHLLVAGTTGSGKSVAINAMILSLLYKAEPKEVRLIMVDPKMLELSVYQDIPHLLA
ncbi:MAG TPA: DNA translocase FtsK 4TM domain-containing protein, partial [Burkholderiales bacterium]|nr:DNA translocase FtsK 4TM domain-containing protein [Burkholderiales bacterium]